MSREVRVSNFYAILIGGFLVIQGSWGLIDPPPFEIFSTNIAHAVIHIVLGIVGLWMGIKGNSYKFNLFLGILLLAVGVLWFIPGIQDLLINLLNINRAVAYLNISIGVVSLFTAFALGSSRTTANREI
ncbi:DUF4383 domain-containing protein [Autumnicola musiva]|uniref:DUF4383 domain-containing protein n=1 Tax=Autumnicola musiva TaxID=3075589 RepID=A0ABU3D533_9FLAO|nr:DUF4383 domain-containing protein [Zunongwangia sp. F117]MDT0676643.1 DUF4383 domain-containing protein [Zunongwangia sp. F117]